MLSKENSGVFTLMCFFLAHNVIAQEAGTDGVDTVLQADDLAVVARGEKSITSSVQPATVRC